MRSVLESLEDPDPRVVSEALVALNEDSLGGDELEEAMFHLSREYRDRRTD